MLTHWEVLVDYYGYTRCFCVPYVPRAEVTSDAAAAALAFGAGRGSENNQRGEHRTSTA